MNLSLHDNHQLTYWNAECYKYGTFHRPNKLIDSQTWNCGCKMSRFIIIIITRGPVLLRSIEIYFRKS
jgi:hypothetical protein